MSKPAGKCIFCDGLGLTKEHIFADWLRGPLGKKSTHATLRSTRGPEGEGPYKKTRQGDPLTHKLRVVCGACNGGWMSVLQNKTKPILTPLLSGDWSNLSEADLPILAAWVAMTAMVIDFENRGTQMISPEVRADFRKGKEAPANWEIYMGAYDDFQDRTYLHSTRRLYIDYDNGDREPTDGISWTSIGLGKVRFFAMSSTELYANVADPDAMSRAGYWRIWPPCGLPQKGKTMTLTEVRALHENLANLGCEVPFALPPLHDEPKPDLYVGPSQK